MGKVLRIYSGGPRQGIELGQTLCRLFREKRIYISVQVTWGLSDQDMNELAKNGAAELIFGRPFIMESYSVQNLQSYHAIAEYPNYDAYLISRVDQPSLSPIYITGKRIGLLKNPLSRSGHQLPKRALRESGLSEKNYQLIEAESHFQLRQMLEKSDVDLIGSYWGDSDRAQYPDAFVHKIQSDVSGARWYLKSAYYKDIVHCTIEKTLKLLALTDQSKYYRDIRYLDEGCEPS